MDGVLLDSSSTHERAYSSAFKKYQIEHDFRYAEFEGRSTSVVMQEIVESLKLDIGLVPDLIKAKQNFAQEYFLELIEPKIFPGVEEGLSELANIYKMALCTSASQATMDFFFRGRVPKTIFDCLINSDMVSESKPNPHIYLKAMSVLGIGPNNCTVVEDSIAGVMAGLNSGAKVVHIGPIGKLENLSKLQKQSVTNFSNFKNFSIFYLSE